VTRFVRVTDASSTPSSTRTRTEKIPAPSHASAVSRLHFATRTRRERDARTHTYLDCARSASQRTREVIIVAHGVDIVNRW
jgi:hypothetical protein